MVNYVERGIQTEIHGLCNDPAVVPQALKSSPQAPADTPTPPDDLALDKAQLAPHDAAPLQTHHDTPSDLQPSMLLKRKTRPPMIARISLPASDMGDEILRSPPPTEAVMSPLPAANKLHAGHTPIIPRALSPLPHSSGPSTPGAGDEGLSGPLTLPPQPGDGTEDTIPLHVLDQQLEKLRIEQESTLDRSDSVDEVEAVHEDDAAAPLSRRTSKDSQKTDEVEVFDGVLLKKPKMNLGAPLGQA